MKPSWKDAPSWAQSLACDKDGWWHWISVRDPLLTDGKWWISVEQNGRAMMLPAGKVPYCIHPGETLELRPEPGQTASDPMVVDNHCAECGEFEAECVCDEQPEDGPVFVVTAQGHGARRSIVDHEKGALTFGDKLYPESVKAERDALRAENAELRERVKELEEDKARLDWCEQNHVTVFVCYEEVRRPVTDGSNRVESFPEVIGLSTTGSQEEFPTVREAIDAAMQEGKS